MDNQVFSPEKFAAEYLRLLLIDIYSYIKNRKSKENVTILKMRILEYQIIAKDIHSAYQSFSFSSFLKFKFMLMSSKLQNEVIKTSWENMYEFYLKEEKANNLDYYKSIKSNLCIANTGDENINKSIWSWNEMMKETKKFGTCITKANRNYYKLTQEDMITESATMERMINSVLFNADRTIKNLINTQIELNKEKR